MLLFAFPSFTCNSEVFRHFLFTSLHFLVFLLFFLVDPLAHSSYTRPRFMTLLCVLALPSPCTVLWFYSPLLARFSTVPSLFIDSSLFSLLSFDFSFFSFFSDSSACLSLLHSSIFFLLLSWVLPFPLPSSLPPSVFLLFFLLYFLVSFLPLLFFSTSLDSFFASSFIFTFIGPFFLSSFFPISP